MTDFSTTAEDFPKTEIEFDQRFRDIDAYYSYLASIKWPSGFVCEECGHKIYWLSSRYTSICTRCEHQYSLTAVTIMHSTKKPITYWFKAMWWFTMRKSGVNAVNLQELLGLGTPHGLGCKSYGVAPFARIAKNYPAVLRSINFSSAAKSPAKAVAALKAKRLFWLLLKETLSKIK
jgi:hypothetical protein